jgi:hypothetical protein
MIGLCVANSAKLFGKVLTETEVRGRYSPIVKRSDKGYPPTFKVKINISGKNQIKCWGLDKEPRPQPEAWVRCKVQPKITARSLWIMSKDFGVLLEATDVRINETSDECPF